MSVTVFGMRIEKEKDNLWVVYDPDGVFIEKFQRKYQAIIFCQKRAGELHRMSIKVRATKNGK